MERLCFGGRIVCCERVEVMLKNLIAKKMLSYTVKCNLPGRLRIAFEHYEMLPKGSEQYLHYINEAIMFLQGIDKVQVNLMTGSILCTYSNKDLKNTTILQWIDKIIDEGFEIYKELAKENIANERQIEMRAWDLLSQKLKQEAISFNEK